MKNAVTELQPGPVLIGLAGTEISGQEQENIDWIRDAFRPTS